ncbi:Uncharacterised protein [Klebsiella quasivariicola]|uniref:Uncharacterized protein n=1 Tax=Klebsiella quasivariicola TaxID=2026240 RepID=A0ABY6WZ13_9ENTR|nr:Uncharacterised protein [Klebsiella quasivariicola]
MANTRAGLLRGLTNGFVTVIHVNTGAAGADETYALIQHSPSNVAGITRAVGSHAHHIHERCSDLRFNNDAGYVFDDRSCKITETSLAVHNEVGNRVRHTGERITPHGLNLTGDVFVLQRHLLRFSPKLLDKGTTTTFSHRFQTALVHILHYIRLSRCDITLKCLDVALIVFHPLSHRSLSISTINRRHNPAGRRSEFRHCLFSRIAVKTLRVVRSIGFDEIAITNHLALLVVGESRVWRQGFAVDVLILQRVIDLTQCFFNRLVEACTCLRRKTQLTGQLVRAGNDLLIGLGYHRINTLLLRGSNIGALKALVRGDFVGLSRIGKTLFNRVLLRSTQIVKFLIAYSREIALVYAHLVLAGDHIPEKVSQRFACIWIDEITNLFARVVRDKLYAIARLRLSAQLRRIARHRFFGTLEICLRHLNLIAVQIVNLLRKCDIFCIERLFLLSRQAFTLQLTLYTGLLILKRFYQILITV